MKVNKLLRKEFELLLLCLKKKNYISLVKALTL